ncbi:6-phospho-3-hexuloisomerase [Nocardia sp. NPDC048505]|uniref:6-phospho-3-hexuloisomerase n=1 Tax=unclassified Nocardia TaxID=2637762 RepID=UPI0033CD1602
MVDQNDDTPVDLGRPERTEESTAGEVERALWEVSTEIAAALRRVDTNSAAALVDEIAAAERIFVVAAGRSKLMADAFAMRLVHLGYRAYITSDATTPAIGSAPDLLIACSGSGETPTVVEHAETARRAAARIVVVTATAESRLARLAHTLVTIPERSADGSIGQSTQFIGTLFEQTALAYLDAIVLLMERLGGADRHEMLERHTNFE